MQTCGWPLAVHINEKLGNQEKGLDSLEHFFVKFNLWKFKIFP